MKRIVFLLLSIGLLSTQFAACSFSDNNKHSLIVLALESLSFNDFNCFNDEYPNIKNFCSESVRFTHAFSPSPLSQASLTSLLFGGLPLEHKTIHNGNLFISNHNISLAEKAIKKGLNTSFYSGGINIWRKSGLAQGFEIFDDNVIPKNSLIYREATENVSLFNRWVNKSNKSFFSVLYLPDLEFNKKNSEDKMLVIDNALHNLRKNLKKRKLWNKTHIIIVGLNGDKNNFKHNEPKGLNLYSENSMVSLLIKPPTKKRDLPVNWTVDNNVDFTIINKAINSYLLDKRKNNTVIIDSIKEQTLVNSPIILETAWPQWRQVASSRFALRNNQFYTIYDKDVKIFNSFSDREELFPFTKSDMLFKTHSLFAQSIFNQKGLQSFDYTYSPLLDKIEIAELILKSKNPKRVTNQLAQLTKKLYWDKNMILWEIKYLLNLKKWDLLYEKSKIHKMSAAQYVSSLHFAPDNFKIDFPCQKYFYSSDKEINDKNCQDELLKKAHSWISSKDKLKKSRFFFKFIANYKAKKLNEKIEFLNFAHGLTWDTRLTPGRDTLLTDLYLSIPKNKRHLNSLAKYNIAKSF